MEGEGRKEDRERATALRHHRRLSRVSRSLTMAIWLGIHSKLLQSCAHGPSSMHFPCSNHHASDGATVCTASCKQAKLDRYSLLKLSSKGNCASGSDPDIWIDPSVL